MAVMIVCLCGMLKMRTATNKQRREGAGSGIRVTLLHITAHHIEYVPNNVANILLMVKLKLSNLNRTKIGVLE
jgi:hypothetical protein